MYSKHSLFRPVQQFGLSLSLQPASAWGTISPQKNAKYPHKTNPRRAELHPRAPMTETFLAPLVPRAPAAGLCFTLDGTYKLVMLWRCRWYFLYKIQIRANFGIDTSASNWCVKVEPVCAPALLYPPVGHRPFQLLLVIRKDLQYQPPPSPSPPNLSFSTWLRNL